MGQLLRGCGEYVDFVPMNYPHFAGPTIVQQHQIVETLPHDDPETKAGKGREGEKYSSLSAFINVRKETDRVRGRWKKCVMGLRHAMGKGNI